MICLIITAKIRQIAFTFKNFFSGVTLLEHHIALSQNDHGWRKWEVYPPLEEYPHVLAE